MVKSSMQNFRAREQKSGRTFYYFDAGGKPRREIPLGDDYILAVRKWAELMALPPSAVPVVTMIELIDRYEAEELKLLAPSTQATYRSDIKHLREFFGQPAPAPLDGIKPSHIKKLLKWKKDRPTTANRLKRLTSTIFNFGRGEGYTDKENPCKGIEGWSLDGRDVDITDEVFMAVYEQADAPTQDAMDLAEATGQRPGDTLRMTEQDIKDGLLGVKQGKTKAKRRIRIVGRLAGVLSRIKARKAGYKVWSSSLVVNTRGLPLTKWVLRDSFTAAREAAALKAEAEKNTEFAAEIRAFWFYDLRAKAADDIAEVAGEQAATDLLGHDNVKTTQDHYLRRGKIVNPSK
jgi:integrase